MKIVTGILQILLCLVVILSVWGYLALRKNASAALAQTATEKNELVQSRKDILSANFNAQFNNNRPAPDSVALYDIATGQQLNMPFLVLPTMQPPLFLRIDNRYCVDCIDTSLVILRSIRQQYGDAFRYYIIGSFPDERNLRFYLSQKKIGESAQVLTVPEGGLSLPAENALQPYFFTLNENLQIQDFFFPVKSEPTYNAAFIQSLSKYLHN
ncbi:hypothetical protein [Chitinophaga deserti]|uniref:hypothetical protein n=1 Tax=Chitinophaga deserti TaxID=2164099 RepID=UPI000D6B2CDB|nr:hypothetical protein [Chitinophaga deserti]